MSRKIRDINEKLKSINQEATDFGLQRHLRAHAPNFVSSHTSRETASCSDSSNVVGREDYASTIVKIFSNNSTHDEQEVFSILPIVGMSGLGKTTIAKLVYNDEWIKRHFDKLIWVGVSQKFDTKDTFKEILQSLTGQRQMVNFDTKSLILKNVREILQGKKYLLVLDDVWCEETEKWGKLRKYLSSISSVEGNGIIVTTRKENVASIAGTIRGPKLNKLSNENCWSIIKAVAFHGRSVIPLEFETIGEERAKRCKGLPLPAIVLGCLLYGRSKEEWQSIEETRLSDLGEAGNSVIEILKLSFDDLPSLSLKKCFAFCSIFPKGFLIKNDMLNYMWMAEGFLHSVKRNDMENVGEEYFQLLLRNSLLQNPLPDDDGNILYCEMDDLMHDLAPLVSHESGPVRFKYMESNTEISKEEAANLRSLIIEGKVSENMFAHLKFPRGLVIIGRDNKELPKMDQLIHLRYLDVSNTGIEYLPSSIGNFYHLQTLRAGSDLNEMPEKLKKLINLRHLHILGHESNIEKLRMLGHLPHLKPLRLESLRNVRSVGDSSDGIHGEVVGEDKIIRRVEISGNRSSG